MEDKGEVTTLVDSLFNLIKEKKEISIPDAAKILETNPKVVEQWALFLEEEGFVTINYGLSSPTIKYKSSENFKPIEPSDEEDFNVENVDVASKIKEVEDDLKNNQKLSAEMANRIINSLNKIFSAVSSHYDDKAFVSKLKEKYQLINKVLNQIASGKISSFKAKVAHNTILKNLEDMRNQILEKINSDEQVKLDQMKSNLASEEGKKPEIFSDIKYLLQQAQEYSKKGELDKARQLYKKISELKSKIPEIYYKKNLELVENIVDFDKQLIENLKEKATKDFDMKEKQIMILLSQAKSYAARDKIEMADNSLKKATDLFNELPSGFIQRKTELQNKMLQMKSRLLQIKNKVETKKYSLLEDKLKAVIKKIDNLLQKKEIDEAKNLLNLGQRLITMIPKEFYAEKKELNNELIQASQRLDIVSEEVQKEKFEEQMSNVKAQIKLIEKAVKAGKTDFAVKNYIEAASLFKQLPEGFLKEKNPVQEKLLDLYSQINEMVLKEKVKRFSYDFNKIKELLEEANKLIDANKLKEAQDYYERILKLYDKLPAGFLERKTMLRLNILNLYDKIRDKYNDMNKNLLSSLKLLPSEESEK
jgi:hypothetical protein